MKSVLITGVGSGIGHALAKAYLERGATVYALGRHEPVDLLSHPNFYFHSLDLSDVDFVRDTIKPFIHGHTYDLVILNAGMLGEIKTMDLTNLKELKAMMDLNVWANKQLLDSLLVHTKTAQVVAISSGASVNGSKGWGGYALSKATLNMLIKLYAHEKTYIHFSAIAPGVVMTPMIRRLLDMSDRTRYPSVQNIQDGPILRSDQAAEKLLAAFEKAREYESGSFLDIRQMEGV